MATLSFLGDLNKQQMEMARLVGEAALKAGVPPRLAIAVAFRESSLDQNKTGESGEIGMMQVLPSTGKDIGYSVQDLRNLEKNIEAGVKYLKMNLDQFKDEGLAIAAYNTGPGNVSNGIIPERTKLYLSDLKNFGAFNVPEAQAQTSEPSQPTARPAAEAPAQAPAPEENASEVEAEEEPIDLDKLNNYTPPPIKDPKADPQRSNAAAIGALTGAGVGLTRGAAGLVTRGVENLGGAWARGAAAAKTSNPFDLGAAVMQAGAGQAPSMGSGAPPAPGAPPAAPGGPSAAPGAVANEAYPRATGPGSATFNWGRSYGLPEIEAAQATDTTKNPGGAQDLINKRTAALQQIQTRFPFGSFAENPAYGGIMTPSASVGSGPKASFVMQPTEAPTPEAPAGRAGGLRSVPVTQPVPTVRLETRTAGTLEKLTKVLMAPFEGTGNVLREMGAPVAKATAPAIGALARVAGPAAGGYSIGQDIYDINKEMRSKTPDYTNVGLSGLGALGTGMMFVPGMAAVGAPLAIAAPAVKNVRQQYQKVQADPMAYQETMQGALSNVNPMGNPLQ